MVRMGLDEEASGFQKVAMAGTLCGYRLKGMKRLRTAITLLLVFAGCCLSDSIEIIPIKSKRAGPLFQIHHGKKWGYMDRGGRVVIPPQFDGEGDFFAGLARVKKDGLWGYIDEVGRLRIPYKFDSAGDFKEGLAAVQISRQWGYINSIGKIVIRPQFQGAAEFSDGMGRVVAWETIQCDRGPTYTNDEAPLHLFTVYSLSPHCKDNRRFGYVGHDGTVSISPKFTEAEDFAEGLAVVRIGEGNQGRYGFIDKTGKVVIEAKFDSADGFVEGMSMVCVTEASGLCGFIDHSGRFAIPARFASAESFSDGLAIASVEDGGIGFIDKRGAFVIPPKFQQAQSFSDGLAFVRSDPEANAYFIDKKGRAALKLKLEVRWPFSDGLTVAGSPGKQVYVDRQGTIVGPYEIDPQW